MNSDFTGQCLCGSVTFHGNWDDRELNACHCQQCRRWSGHVWASTSATGLQVKGEVRWYRSSDFAQRGFCPTCGSSLFWKRDGSDFTDIAAGAVDVPSGLRLSGHIFVADKGDYYDITDDLPQSTAG